MGTTKTKLAGPGSLTTGGVLENDVQKQGSIIRLDRLDNFRHAYRQRLRERIHTDFAVLADYMGEELFCRMVNRYFEICPADCLDYRRFGDGLAHFLRGEFSFGDDQILAEIATFESLLLGSIYAADGTRCDTRALSGITPETWASLHLELHPSTKLFFTPSNAVAIWCAMKNRQIPPLAAATKPNAWLI